MAQLTDSIRYVRGIGEKKAALFHKLDIFTLADALFYYPRGYEDRTQVTDIAGLEDGVKTCVRAVIATAPATAHIRRGMDLTKFKVFDETGTLEVTYFNNKYSASKLVLGQEYVFFGKVQGNSAHRVMLNPEFEQGGDSGSQTQCILPLYPLTAGISAKDVRRVIEAALGALPETLSDFIPKKIRDRYQLLPFRPALEVIHKPQTLPDALEARKRLIFEELLLLACGLGQLKKRRDTTAGIRFGHLDLSAFYKALPFPLTGAQKRAIDDMTGDLTQGRAMNRLVQGDVGSGKTMVAAALCALAAQNGFQSAIMAPTEILAAQHMESLSPLFDALGIHAVLLTGSMKAKAKKEALLQLADGQAQVAVGTQALIQEGVQFHRLGAVVVDEQHRFGVKQRAVLAGKGESPHILVMSATPIPRTLALIVYGDLDVSVIDELPPGRTPVETYAVGETMRQRVYRFMDKQCAAGGQVYVVCPLIEEGEEGRKNAEGYAENLRTRVFPHRLVGLIHGRLSSAEKERIMAQFAEGKLDILVSTTVIEVGVNIPNATLMVIEDADSFGLSQLHQLRGRVGRGNRQSYCILFGADKGENARKRLKILCKTTDGFEISRADLELRGPGDFFGSRQHGLPELKLADLSSDMRLLQDAQGAAMELLAESPDLTAFPKLKARVERMFHKPQGNIFN